MKPESKNPKPESNLHIGNGDKAVAYCEQLKLPMPKWLMDKDQVSRTEVRFSEYGGNIGALIIGMGFWGSLL